jgi:hypothetical protein
MTKDLQKKLADIQTKISVPKKHKNSFGGYMFRKAEDILEAVKGPLCEAGLLMTISDDILYIGDRYYVKSTVTITDGKEATITTSALAREVLDKKGMDSSQITGGASSYARKYALGGMFAIDDSTDPDVTNDNKKEVDDSYNYLKESLEICSNGNELNAFKVNQKTTNSLSILKRNDTKRYNEIVSLGNEITAKFNHEVKNES